MQWLGEVSFGFYLCQGIVIFYGRILIGNYKYFSIPVSIGILLGLLVTTLVAGWLLYTFVERPMMRRWSRSRKQASPGRARAQAAPTAHQAEVS
jgi:peptidoglycan/LPS O-acetylase OafA/YrhL